MTDEQAWEDDPDVGFHRARRALRHLWSINRGVKKYNPEGCDGCKEVYKYLTDPTYRGEQRIIPPGTDSTIVIGH